MAELRQRVNEPFYFFVLCRSLRVMDKLACIGSVGGGGWSSLLGQLIQMLISNLFQRQSLRHTQKSFFTSYLSIS